MDVGWTEWTGLSCKEWGLDNNPPNLHTTHNMSDPHNVTTSSAATTETASVQQVLLDLERQLLQDAVTATTAADRRLYKAAASALGRVRRAHRPNGGQGQQEVVK